MPTTYTYRVNLKLHKNTCGSGGGCASAALEEVVARNGLVMAAMEAAKEVVEALGQRVMDWWGCERRSMETKRGLQKRLLRHCDSVVVSSGVASRVVAHGRSGMVGRDVRVTVNK